MEKRQRLGRRVLAFHSKSSGMIGEFDSDLLILNEADVVAGDEIPDSELVGSDGEEGDEPEDARNWVYEVDDLDDENLDHGEGIADYPEKIPLVMPSAMGKENITIELVTLSHASWCTPSGVQINSWNSPWSPSGVLQESTWTPCGPLLT